MKVVEITKDILMGLVVASLLLVLVWTCTLNRPPLAPKTTMSCATTELENQEVSLQRCVSPNGEICYFSKTNMSCFKPAKEAE
jgi:hypothetical protein